MTSSEQAQQALQSLQNSVRKALDRKRRLGQYAVIWKNGRPQRLSAEEMDKSSKRDGV